MTPTPTPSRRATAARRYPALLYLGGAALLALLLPSGLNVLQAGPSTLAEVAPVPGEGESAGDLQSLEAASSEGIGAGPGLGGAEATGAAITTTTTSTVVAANGRVVRRPGTKRCVGDPPRQTEDPLSPPCVAFFEGDNGGATTKGVSGEEIAVVVHLGSASSQNPRGLYDLDKEPAANEDDFRRATRAYARFITDRYQLYGRRLRAFAFYGASKEDPAGLRSDIAAIDEQLSPFAVVALTSLGDSNGVIAGEAARRQIIGVSKAGDRRAEYASLAPFRITFDPDIEDQAAIAASYLCTKIAGRVARWHGDVTMRSERRRFAILTSGQAADEPQRQLAGELSTALADRCGERPARAEVSNATHYSPVLAGFRSSGVTTVIISASSGVATNASHQAAAQGWFPEWFIAGGATSDIGADRTSSGQLANQQEWRAAFGITFDYRRAGFTEQPWYLAYREGCGQCVEPRADLSALYDDLVLLAYGIQAAGPKLSPSTFDRGLHAIPAKPADDPFRPAAYFSADNYSFVKDAAEIWWDPAGIAPGDSRPGCFRLVGDGLRSRAADWTGGDDALFSGSPACQGNPQRPVSG